MKRYTATLEPFGYRVSVIRVHEEPHGKIGDPWVYGCLVRRDVPPLWKRLWLRLTGGPAEVVAFMCLTHAAPTLAQIAAMRAALRSAGFTRAVWHRRKGDRVRLVGTNLVTPPVPIEAGLPGGLAMLLPGQVDVREALAEGGFCEGARRTGPFTCESCLAVTTAHAGDAVLCGGVNYAPVCRSCVDAYHVAGGAP